MKNRERVPYVNRRGEVKMLRKGSTTGNRLTAADIMADKPKEYRREQVSGYYAADEDKQNNNRSSLSADSVTSTGETISPNGIRLWGMW